MISTLTGSTEHCDTEGATKYPPHTEHTTLQDTLANKRDNLANVQ